MRNIAAGGLLQFTRLFLILISSYLFPVAPSRSLSATDDSVVLSEYPPSQTGSYTPVQYVTPEITAARAREQTNIEWIKALAVWLPALVVVYTFWGLRKAIETHGITKAVELALNTSSPEEASFRARFIYRLMNKNLPAEFDATLERLSRKRPKIEALPPHIIEARTTLIRTLAEFPAQREQILDDWSSCFGPIDAWPARITRTVPHHSFAAHDVFWPES
jgi:hypothetical protein